MKFKDFLRDNAELFDLQHTWVQPNKCFGCLAPLMLDDDVTAIYSTKEGIHCTFLYHTDCKNK